MECDVAPVSRLYTAYANASAVWSFQNYNEAAENIVLLCESSVWRTYSLRKQGTFRFTTEKNNLSVMGCFNKDKLFENRCFISPRNIICMHTRL